MTGEAERVAATIQEGVATLVRAIAEMQEQMIKMTAILQKLIHTVGTIEEFRKLQEELNK